MRILVIDPSNRIDNTVTLEKDYYHYLKNVRRVNKGDRIKALIGNEVCDLIVDKIQRDKIRLVVLNSSEPSNKLLPEITVYQGMLKSKKMDYLIARLSELGVKDFFPFYSCRSVIQGEVGEKKFSRWERLSREGVKVSGLEQYMKIHFPLPIDRIIEDFRNLETKAGYSLRLLFTTSGDSIHIKDVIGLTNSKRVNSVNGDKITDNEVQSYDSVYKWYNRAGIELSKMDSMNGNFTCTSCFLVFGPEGGFSPEEESMLKESGFIPVNMGAFIMRAETAAIVGTGLIRVIFS